MKKCIRLVINKNLEGDIKITVKEIRWEKVV